LARLPVTRAVCRLTCRNGRPAELLSVDRPQRRIPGRELDLKRLTVRLVDLAEVYLGNLGRLVEIPVNRVCLMLDALTPALGRLRFPSRAVPSRRPRRACYATRVPALQVGFGTSRM
jgi:hypothetical protein